MRVLTMTVLLSVLAVAGCAKTSVIPLSANKVQVLADAAPMCGPTGAQDVAFKTAAVTTIQKGFDRFVIGGVGRDSQVSFINQRGSSDINVLGGSSAINQWSSSATIGRRNQNVLTVKMFRASDPGAKNR